VCARATPRDRSDRARDRGSYFFYLRARSRAIEHYMAFATRVIRARRADDRGDRPRANPKTRSRPRVSAFLHTRISTMSALLASSFVGRVAAFKATKIQVRIF